MMTPKENLIAAKTILTPDIWRQGKEKIFDGSGVRLCMAMAVHKFTPKEDPDDYRAIIALAQAINPEVHTLEACDVIIKTNDDPKTTLEMVHAWFDTAIQNAAD